MDRRKTMVKDQKINLNVVERKFTLKMRYTFPSLSIFLHCSFISIINRIKVFIQNQTALIKLIYSEFISQNVT